MRIKSLKLHNFRFFAEKQFEFPALFTVLIGENGRGKSALLQGLRIAAGAWLLGFREAERLHIEVEDIRRVDEDGHFNRQWPTRIEATGSVEGEVVDWARQRSDIKGGLGRTGWAEAKPLIDLARRYEEANAKNSQGVALPVLVYFGTGRQRIGAKRAVELKAKGSKIEDGYAQALISEYKRKGPTGSAVAMGWIKATYFRYLQGHDSFLLAVDIASGKTAAPPRRPIPQLDAVFQAITTCVQDWTALLWDLETDDLSGLYHRPDGTSERVPLYYLSDGVRMMVSIVAEIAYRCVMLNGHLGAEAVLESKGLVLIDELDMHLHPNWQRRVVSDLKKAFPNLQFVVTTHSPFIVQSLDTAEIISLDYEDLGEQSPKELPVGEVAVNFMNVESELSKQSEENQEAAEAHLAVLQTAQEVAGGRIDLATSQELQELEESVSDLSLRMTLRMERILREHPATPSSNETN